MPETDQSRSTRSPRELEEAKEPSTPQSRYKVYLPDSPAPDNRVLDSATREKAIALASQFARTLVPVPPRPALTSYVKRHYLDSLPSEDDGE